MPPRFLKRLPWPCLPFWLTAAAIAVVQQTPAAENYLIIGDSLSKEYQVEFPALYPLRPAAWEARNWIELLSTHRSQQVDIGPFGFWPDTRLTGHRFNWAFPGSQTSEWVDILEATAFRDPQKWFLRLSLDAQLADDSERVVIFLGGNDVNNNYRTFYDGADPTAFVAAIIDNITEIVDYVLARNDDLEIVLVNLPDVGVTPKNIASRPDPEKRLRVTSLTRQVNEGLRALAEARGIGYADIFRFTRELEGPERYVIGGVLFEKAFDPSTTGNAPTYLFSPDGFHPNTAAQLAFANEIVETFNRYYPASAEVRPFSTEEKLRLLGLDPDVSFAAWASAYGLDNVERGEDEDGDGASAFQEFIFDGDPRSSNNDLLPAVVATSTGISFRYRLRVAESRHFSVSAEQSTGLSSWMEVAPEAIFAWGTERTVPATNTSNEHAAAFFRLHLRSNDS